MGLILVEDLSKSRGNEVKFNDLEKGKYDIRIVKGKSEEIHRRVSKKDISNRLNYDLKYFEAYVVPSVEKVLLSI